MCFKRCGRSPHTARQGVACAGAIGLLLALAGCASEGSAPYSSNPTATAMHMAGAGAATGAEIRPSRVVIEADGLPAQLAPRDRPSGNDDPREPWSPNYGNVRPSKASAIGTPAVVAVAFTHPAALFRTQPIDAEDIIRRAVAAHEMRQED